MGKTRIKALGEEKQEKEDKKRQKEERERKKIAKASLEEKTPLETLKKETSEEPLETKKPQEEKKTKEKVSTKKHSRSKRYKELALLVDKKKTYPLKESLSLLEKLKSEGFDETVELHINTLKTGISGNVTLPHGNGKTTRVATADDKLIEEIEKGKISFDVLVATPQMMPKLAKVAKILGPKGLMPNPKNGTITENPQELVEKFGKGRVSFKTEAKTPIVHIAVGKLSFGPQKLSENITTVVDAIKGENIKDITLKSSMSPGLRVQI
jgi:large subunit ribosomal protein L1